MERGILITGGAGQLGRALKSVLTDQGATDVMALDLPDLDVTNQDSVMEAVERLQPLVVYHCAAMTDVDGCERDEKRAFLVNAVGTSMVSKACRSVDAILAYFSTDFVFDGRLGRPYREGDEPRPLSAYGRTKLLGEQRVAETAEHLIIRTAWLFGEGSSNFVTKIIERAKRDGALGVVDDQKGSPTYATDLAQGTVSLLRTGARGIFHVANTGSCTRYEFASAILREAGMPDIPLRPLRTVAAPGIAVRPANSPLDTGKFAATVGSPLRTWTEALHDYVSTFRPTRA